MCSWRAGRGLTRSEWISRGRVTTALAWGSTGSHGEVCGVAPWKAAPAGFRALPMVLGPSLGECPGRDRSLSSAGGDVR